MEVNIYEKKQRWKFLLFLSAIVIGVGSLAYTNKLVTDLSIQEHQKVELWAEATEVLIKFPQLDSSSSTNLMNLPLKVIENNITIPIILTDSTGDIITYRNLDTVRARQENYLIRKLMKMKEENDPIEIDLGGGDKNYIYYMDSTLLTRLFFFPYVQLLVIMLFIFVSYLAFSSSRNAEQNKVWVGLSKETAHQLGTPTSSLNAWIELLKEGTNQNDIIDELEKDVKRLEKITERFSKIGSRPILTNINLIQVIHNSIHYLKSRSSEKIRFNFKHTESEIVVPLNEALFEWVIENVCKNAMDAMNGKGEIRIRLEDHTQFIYLDVVDTGKGISKSRFKTAFSPGYTTKKRGWGLGLSLSKRIIESYHEGKIFVLSSELNVGTTIRIVLRKYVR